MPHTDHRSAASPFLCEIRTDWERAIVITHGTLDAASFPQLEGAIQRLCTAGFSAIVLDLRAPGSVAPTGLALLHRIDALASRHQVTLSLDLQRTDADQLLEATTA
jgi:alpha-beta hydrolase superfamily lysophospholipase